MKLNTLKFLTVLPDKNAIFRALLLGKSLRNFIYKVEDQHCV
jgi:hypothetical protein